MLRKIFFITSLALSLLAVGVGSASAVEAVQQVRLYAIDCGRIDIKDMGMFADTGEYDGKAGKVVTPPAQTGGLEL